MTAPKQPQDHLPGKKNPVTTKAFICNDTELADEFYERQEEFFSLRMRMSQGESTLEMQRRFDELQPRLRELQLQIRASALMFQFKSIGRTAFEKLIDDNPPTAKSKAALKEAGEDENALRWDPETFFPALVEKSCVSVPEGIDLKEIWTSSDWNESELGELSQAALNANISRRIVPLGNV